MAADAADDAAAERLADLLGELEREAFGLGACDEGVGEWMGGEPVDAGRQTKRLVRVEPVEGHERFELGLAEGDGARLVEENRVRLAELLDRSGALDDDADASAAGEPGHQGDRGGEDQGARSGDDEDGERPNGVSGERPRDSGDDRGDGEEDRGVAIGDPHERRRLLLRRFDEADEGRVRALGGGTECGHLEGDPRARRAAAHLAAAPHRHRAGARP